MVSTSVQQVPFCSVSEDSFFFFFSEINIDTELNNMSLSKENQARYLLMYMYNVYAAPVTSINQLTTCSVLLS